ncbi:hypothetical protein A8W25_17015 [Streptomyces sp. ERV7]|uniref:hypothetical protein n=1 Tax=Streptomyces sp. ERV7 TaxID=1322334 RepID=UPI0007F4880C|nr:hypothetical protein [Streptomyces sp. ERV7]OAR24149.1 hypothetical protein A8W25_17015 [Streptomyces sp. ERV7]
MNMQQGAEKADVILQKTLAGITPGLRWVHDSSEDISCSDWKNAGTGTSSVIRGVMVMTIVSPERRGALLGVVERNWKASGYKITRVNASKELPSITAFTPENFQVHVAVGGEGQFRFSVTTPCLTDSPVQRPTTPSNVDTNTPAYEGGKFFPRPYLHDDFWSAKTPART